VSALPEALPDSFGEPGVDSKPGLAAIFLLSLGVLLLEIALTRIFSFSLWYHFIYVALSVGLLGYGASGAVLAVSERLAAVPPNRIITGSMLLAALGVLLSFFTIAFVPLRGGNGDGRGVPCRRPTEPSLLRRPRRSRTRLRAVGERDLALRSARRSDGRRRLLRDRERDRGLRPRAVRSTSGSGLRSWQPAPPSSRSSRSGRARRSSSRR
jgi:hypothetical protein